MNKQYKQPGWNLWNSSKHWFNNVKMIPCPKCKGIDNCDLCHSYRYIRETTDVKYIQNEVSKV